MKILGAGGIGAAVVRQYIRETHATVVNVDKRTYAGILESLAKIRGCTSQYFRARGCFSPASKNGYADYLRSVIDS